MSAEQISGAGPLTMPCEYTVTVETDGNGTALASQTTAIYGTEISLDATPNEGYEFKEWKVVSGEATISNNTFTVKGDVTIKTIFKEIGSSTPSEEDDPEEDDPTTEALTSELTTTEVTTETTSQGPTTTGSSVTSADGPKTGDSSRTVMCTLLMSMAFLGIFAVCTLRKRDIL